MRAARVAFALALVWLGTEGLLLLAAAARGPVVFDVGPSTGAYGDGFTPSEERPPTTFRWTRDHATLELPLLAEAGRARLSARLQGTFRRPTPVHVLVGGRTVATLAAQAGPFQVSSAEIQLPPGRLQIDLLPEGPADPGVAVDWIRIEDARCRIPGEVWQLRVLVAGLFLLALAAGFSTTGAAAAAATLALAAAGFASRDPFACAHVAQRLAVPCLLLALAGLLLVRTRPGRRFVLLLFVASYLLKGAALFYPSYFYNDVRNNHRYVQALGGKDGTLLERSHKAQLAIGVAYPRIVAGKKYAFPYSPVFFLPFTLLPADPLTIDEAMKHVVLALAAAEVLLVYGLAGLVFGPSAGVWAALCAAFVPVLSSRLLLALWATLGGHFLDTLLLGAALLMAEQPQRLWPAAAFALASTASLLTYVASLFNVSLFASALALVDRRRALRILLVLVAGVVWTVGLLYRDFVVIFVREILPAALTAHGSEGGVLDSAGTTLERIWIFYGFGFPALSVAGFVLLRRRARPEAARVVTAYALAFAGLLLLRSVPGGLFKDLKEVEFAVPLVALTAGASLEELAARGRLGRWAAALVAVGLAGFSLARYANYVATWTALAP